MRVFYANFPAVKSLVPVRSRWTGRRPTGTKPGGELKIRKERPITP